MNEPEQQRGRRLKRRDVLMGAVSGAAACTAASAAAQAPAEPVSAGDVETLAGVWGREFSADQRALMAQRVPGIRTTLRALRAAPAGELDEPATHFDPRVPGTRLPAGKSVCSLSRSRTPALSGGVESLAFASAADLSRLLKARRITSTALTRMYLERLKRYGPALFCVVNLTEERALEQAARADREIASGHYRGPLHGIPWGAKDLLATRGIPTTWGARPFRNQVFDYDATVVKRLEEAGAVLVAKLSMGELAQGDVWFGGTTRNPWKPASGSSGSSAGPGSATAAGLVGFSIGSETHGSIVSPSIVNGVTGLRPTYGRVPRTGAMSLCWTMDKLGPMCRTVEDCALVLSVIHGPDGYDASCVEAPFQWTPGAALKPLRVGIDSEAFAVVAKDAKRASAYAEALAVLRRLGIEPKPVRLPAMTDAFRGLPGLMIGVESAASFAKLTESGGLDELVRQTSGAWPTTFRVGATIPAADYLQALRVRRRLQLEMAEALRDLDGYVTVPNTGPTTAYTNLTGHPTVVTRCGMLEGAPLSLEFVGALYREDAILRVAHAFEQATSWHKLAPDLRGIPTA